MKYTKKALALVLAAAMALSMAGCGGKDGSSGLTELTVCLDWTPNTNHTGLYVAQQLGYFEEAGLEVALVQPPEDGAVAACAAGQVEFAVNFQDYLAPAFGREDPLEVTAVAALLQHNTSGILSRSGEGMDTPRGLEGRTYATWNLPVEQEMLQAVMAAEGADFEKVNLIPNNITDEAGALREHQTDAVWVYYGWSGISAQLSGLDHDYFAFKDIDPVFDFYTPVLVANNRFLKEQPDTAKAFLAAVAKGYEYAIANPDEAAQMLMDGDDTGSLRGSEELILTSQRWMAGQYKAEADQWGYIDPVRWNAFYNWLNDNGLVDAAIPENTGFSNDYLAP